MTHSGVRLPLARVVQSPQSHQSHGSASISSRTPSALITRRPGVPAASECASIAWDLGAEDHDNADTDNQDGRFFLSITLSFVRSPSPTATFKWEVCVRIVQGLRQHGGTVI